MKPSPFLVSFSNEQNFKLLFFLWFLANLVGKIISKSSASLDNSTIFPQEYPKMKIIDLKADESEYFLFNISLGTPPQPFRVLLDTGSLYLWVLQEGNKGAGFINNKFNEKKSLTYKPTEKICSIVYDSGYCNGIVCSDMLKIKNSNSVSNSDNVNLSFVLAKNTNFDAENADGIAGFGRSNKGEIDSIIQSLYDNHIIDLKVFSVKGKFHSQGEENPKLYIGGIHKDFQEKYEKCGLLKVNPKIPRWECGASFIPLFSQKSIKSDMLIEKTQEYKVIFDTGYNKIVFPNKLLISLSEAYKENVDRGRIFNGNGYLYFSCRDLEKLPNFLLKFSNGTSILIPKRVLFQKAKTDFEYSTIKTISFQDVDNITLGGPFFQYYHTLFNEENSEMWFSSKNNSDLIQCDIEVKGGKVKKIIITAMILIGTALVFSLLFLYIKKRKANREVNELKVKINAEALREIETTKGETAIEIVPMTIEKDFQKYPKKADCPESEECPNPTENTKL